MTWRVQLGLRGTAREVGASLLDGGGPVVELDEQVDEEVAQSVLCYEYFHGDNGAGIGASHQAGWTRLAAVTAALFHLISAEDWLTRGGESARRPAGVAG